MTKPPAKPAVKAGPLKPAGRPAARSAPERAESQRPSTRSPSTQSPSIRSPGTQRLFYALRVPAEVTAPLAEAQSKLRGNWRAVRPDQMHVTLSYLPAVPPERVEDLKRLGVRLAAQQAPLELSLRGTGYFPNEGSPRVWFVKAEAEGLSELAAALRSGIEELGLETDDLSFKPHITLARKKGPAPRIPPLLFGTGWTAPAVTLYRSILRKTGPIYEVQSTFRLRGTPPPSPEVPALTEGQETP